MPPILSNADPPAALRTHTRPASTPPPFSAEPAMVPARRCSPAWFARCHIGRGPPRDRCFAGSECRAPDLLRSPTPLIGGSCSPRLINGARGGASPAHPPATRRPSGAAWHFSSRQSQCGRLIWLRPEFETHPLFQTFRQILFADQSKRLVFTSTTPSFLAQQNTRNGSLCVRGFPDGMTCPYSPPNCPFCQCDIWRSA